MCLWNNKARCQQAEIYAWVKNFRIIRFKFTTRQHKFIAAIGNNVEWLCFIVHSQRFSTELTTEALLGRELTKKLVRPPLFVQVDNIGLHLNHGYDEVARCS